MIWIITYFGLVSSIGHLVRISSINLLYNAIVQSKEQVLLRIFYHWSNSYHELIYNHDIFLTCRKQHRAVVTKLGNMTPKGSLAFFWGSRRVHCKYIIFFVCKMLLTVYKTVIMVYHPGLMDVTQDSRIVSELGSRCT